MTRSTARPALVCASLLAAAIALHLVGRAGLEAPPSAPGSWSAWLADRGAAGAALALVRVAAQGAVLYLGVLTAATVFGRGRSNDPVARLRRAPLGRAALALLGLGTPLLLAASPAGATDDTTDGARLTCTEGCDEQPDRTTDSRHTASTSTSVPPSPPATPVTGAPATTTPAGTPTPTAPPTPTPPTPTATVPPPAVPEATDPSTTDPTPVTDAAGTPPGEPAPAMTDPAEAVATWTIEPGDHLWSVARASLHDAGAPTDDRAVHAYLLRLVDANVDVLVEPGNPDLVLPGQVFALPTVRR